MYMATTSHASTIAIYAYLHNLINSLLHGLSQLLPFLAWHRSGTSYLRVNIRCIIMGVNILIWRNAFENRPDQDHCHLRVPWLDDEE
jgi:hypothetical protein